MREFKQPMRYSFSVFHHSAGMVGTFQSISAQIVQSVGTHTETNPLALPPLSDAVDPDALETAIRTMSAGKIQFEYAGHTVTVYSGVGTNGDAEIVVTDEPRRLSDQVQARTDA